MSEINEKMDQAVKAMGDREGKYLTFSLADEEYGIGILKIKEIIGMLPITSVPQTPEFVKGVINLRGKVIPVMDLRLRFGRHAPHRIFGANLYHRGGNCRSGGNRPNRHCCRRCV